MDSDRLCQPLDYELAVLAPAHECPDSHEVGVEGQVVDAVVLAPPGLVAVEHVPVEFPHVHELDFLGPDHEVPQVVLLVRVGRFSDLGLPVALELFYHVSGIIVRFMAFSISGVDSLGFLLSLQRAESLEGVRENPSEPTTFRISCWHFYLGYSMGNS